MHIIVIVLKSNLNFFFHFLKIIQGIITIIMMIIMIIMIIIKRRYLMRKRV